MLDNPDVDEGAGDQPVPPRLSDLVARAKEGDPAALPEIRSVLDEHPEIWEYYGNLSPHVQNKWLDLLAGDDAVVRESVARRLETLRVEILAEVGISPLKQLLADRILVSWLQATYFDSALALAAKAAPTVQVRFLWQQVERSQRQHAAAVKALADVRRLLS
jgi:hypothetical protein